jgi:hypothetical protein
MSIGPDFSASEKYSIEQIFPNWAYPAKTAAHIASQSVDPNRQAEFGLLVLNQVRVIQISQLTLYRHIARCA